MRTLVALAFALGWSGPLEAEGCRLALVLALDISVSVDAEEDRLQRDGLARALLAPEVVRAFLAGDPVALFVFEWSGQRTQVDLMPGWRMIEGEADLLGVAEAVRSSTRQDGSSDFTAVGAALERARAALDDGPPCRARTVDVSGDGRSNDGPAPGAVYGAGGFGGVTVNALVIGGAEDADLLGRWFEDNVLHGPGAFRMTADGYEDYERAMRAKLRRELEHPTVSGGPEAATDGVTDG